MAILFFLWKAVLSRLYRTQPDQEAMVEAAVYFWWPMMHRKLIELCQNFRKFQHGKNIKTSKPFNSSNPLPDLTAPNEELQIDSLVHY